MNYSMFFCSHYFLPNRQQSDMSKRGQEVILEEGSAMAKPKSMNLVMAKPRPVNLVPHKVLSMKKSSAQDLSDSNNPGNAQTGQICVLISTGKLVRDTDQNSQVWKQESTQVAESWKQKRIFTLNQHQETNARCDSHKNKSET